MRTVICTLVLLSTILWSARSLQSQEKEADFFDDVAFSNYLVELKGLPADERVKRLTRMSQTMTMALGGRPVEYKSEPGRLVPPAVMIGGRNGWSPSSDGEPLLHRLFPEHERQRKIAERAILAWRLLIHESHGEAMAWIAQRTSSTVPSVGDVVKLVASMERQPGAILTQKISKELWTKLHGSSNPCYKILALEKYDSTDQSPEELLKLYRECLFQTFGYLQVRALEGIYRSKDYRPEVRNLLREFLASSPAEDDGTLPPFPANFSNPVEGAKRLLAHMEKGGVDSPVPPPPVVVPKPPAR
jgi:hypothetical protein